MNNIFKVIWNHATQSWVATSEFGKAKKKTKSIQVAALAASFGLLSASALAVNATGSGSNDAVAIGTGSVANGNNVAIGKDAKALGPWSVVIGEKAATQAVGQEIYIGYNAGNLTRKNGGEDASVTVDGQSSRNIVIGHNASLGEKGRKQISQSIAIGSGRNGGGNTRETTWVRGDQSIAIGSDVTAYGDSSVAIGGDDLDNAASAEVDFLDQDGNTIKISGASAYYKLTGRNLVEGSGQAGTNWFLGTDLAKYKYVGTWANTAGTAVGVQAVAGNLSTAYGAKAWAMQTNSTAIGTGASATFHNSVALGGGSITDSAGTVQPLGIVNNLVFPWAGGNDVLVGDVVSIGAKKQERQLKNVAAGLVAQTSTDAINGSQLYSVAQRVSSDIGYAGDDGGYDAEAVKEYKAAIENYKAAENAYNTKLAEYQAEIVAYDKQAGVYQSTRTADEYKKLQEAEKKVKAATTALIQQGNATLESNTKLDAILKKLHKGKVATRKLGQTMDFLGGAKKEDLVDDNIGIYYNETDEGVGQLLVKLTKKLKDLESAEFKKEGEPTTVINYEGVTINNPDNLDKDGNVIDKTKTISITKDGINAGSKVIKNVADGEISSTSKEAVNGSQLYKTKNDLIAEGLNFTANNEEDGKKVSVHRDLGTTLAIEGEHDATEVSAKNVYVEADKKNSKLLVKIAENPEFKTIKVGDSDKQVTIGSDTDKSGETVLKVGDKDGNAVKITNVKDGEISETSKDAINGSQLHKVKNDLENKITNVDNRVTNLDEKVNNLGWNITSGKEGSGEVEGNNSQKVKVDNSDTVTLNAGDNLKIKQDGKNFTYSLKDKIEVEKVTVGKDGKQGEIGLNGKDGANATISVTKGQDGVDGKDGKDGEKAKDRIVYETVDKDGKKTTEQVATLNDGLKFSGDNSEVVISKKLNTLLEVVGGADKDKLTKNNIGVNATAKDGKLEVQLSKDLRQIDTIGKDDKNTITFNGDGNGTTITGGDVNVSDNKITGVKPGDISSTSTDAINGSQLYALAKNTIRLGGNSGETEKQTLDQKDGIKFDVKGGDNEKYVTTKASGSEVTVDLSDYAKKRIDEGGYWKLNTSASEGQVSGSEEKMIKGGQVVTVDAGKNIKVTQQGAKVSVATAAEVEFDKVTSKEIVVPTNNGNSVTINKDGINAGGKTISNVAPGVKDTDAVNVSQLRDVEANANARARAGTASAIAAASIPQVTRSGASGIAVSGGTYGGQQAGAIGYSRMSDNGKHIIKLNASRDKYNTGVGAGYMYQW